MSKLQHYLSERAIPGRDADVRDALPTVVLAAQAAGVAAEHRRAR